MLPDDVAFRVSLAAEEEDLFNLGRGGVGCMGVGGGWGHGCHEEPLF